jgi:hypothetical protein
MLEPVTRSFGKQYSMLVTGDLARVGAAPAKEKGAFWLNANAEYPNGDSIKAPEIFDKHGRQLETELGEGSEVSIAFKVVQASNGNTYYNLAQIRVVKFVKAFSVFDLFDAVEESDEPISESF